MTQPIDLPKDPADTLTSLFQKRQVDYVPDPLVLRVADLFIGGKEFVQNLRPNSDIGLGAEDRITPARVWATIEKNIDGLRNSTADRSERNVLLAGRSRCDKEDLQSLADANGLLGRRFSRVSGSKRTNDLVDKTNGRAGRILRSSQGVQPE
jgi:hypothetical protein